MGAGGLRRICSFIADYDSHDEDFVRHFRKRGYNQKKLMQCVADVRVMNRTELLSYQPKIETDGTPLVITYHHKFAGMGKVMKEVYSRMVDRYPELNKVIPSQPMVAYRRTRNIRDKLIRANHHQVPSATESTLPGRSSWEGKMNHSGCITNHQTGQSFKIEGGSARTTGCVYAAECTRHQVIYVGQTGRLVSSRFDGHRSDIKLKPDACGLDSHFREHGCCVDDDLRISILEHVSGSRALREYREERWIARLQTFVPTGLNSSYNSDFGPIYDRLFK